MFVSKLLTCKHILGARTLRNQCAICSKALIIPVAFGYTFGSNHCREQEMNATGSLCPAIRAADIIGDKWVLLILRELLLGNSRYNDFQRALPRISPTILSKRLKHLEASGLIIRKSAAGRKAIEYRLTACGREIAPIIHHMSNWGLRWARRHLEDEDLDVCAFMWDFHRTLNTDELPDGETVLFVRFPELTSYSEWWLLADHDQVDLCMEDPGKDIDVYITNRLPAVAAVWMGDVSVRSAIRSHDIDVTGNANLVRTVNRWFPKSIYSDVRPERIV